MAGMAGHKNRRWRLSGKPLKAVFTGGPSNNLLTPVDLDVALDFESVRARGSSLGTGAMIVVSEGTGIVKRVAEYLRFFASPFVFVRALLLTVGEMVKELWPFVYAAIAILWGVFLWVVVSGFRRQRA